MIVGDMDFTLGASNFWVMYTQLDPLSRYFIRKLEEISLLDIEPSKLLPLVVTRELGKAELLRDMLLSYESFLNEFNHIKQWVTTRGNFNHSFVVLEVALAIETH